MSGTITGRRLIMPLDVPLDAVVLLFLIANRENETAETSQDTPRQE